MYRVNYGNGQVSNSYKNIAEAKKHVDSLDLYKGFAFVEKRDNGEWFQVRVKERNPLGVQYEIWMGKKRASMKLVWTTASKRDAEFIAKTFHTNHLDSFVEVLKIPVKKKRA